MYLESLGGVDFSGSPCIFFYLCIYFWPHVVNQILPDILTPLILSAPINNNNNKYDQDIQDIQDNQYDQDDQDDLDDQDYLDDQDDQDYQDD